MRVPSPRRPGGPIARPLTDILIELCDLKVVGDLIFGLSLRVDDEMMSQQLQYLSVQVVTHAKKGLDAVRVVNADVFKK